MYINQPILVPIIGKESGDRWKLTGSWNGEKNLTGDWVYDFMLGLDHYKLTVPFGFAHLDGASVPRVLRALLKMGGREMPDEAWLPHDFFYYHKGKMLKGFLYKKVGKDWEPVYKVSRKFADQVFKTELKKEKHGLIKFKAPIAFAGVRSAFWKNW